MMSRLSAGLGAAILGLATGAAHAQGCIGPAPCPGGYRPASPAYVFQPGPTPAYQAAPAYAPQPYAPQPYAPGPGDLASYPGYPPAAGYAPEPAPYGYPGLPPAPYAQQPYNYVPAYGRGVYADRPYSGPAPGYDARGCGGCAPPAPAFQPCASPCGPAAQVYAPPAPAEVEAPAVAVTDTFFYGLSGGTGGFPEGGGGGGGINPQGFGFDNGFGISAANSFFNGYSSANAYANASAASNVNVNVNNQAYANANAWAAANANAYAKNVNMPYGQKPMPMPMPMHPWGMPKHGCNCTAHHAGGRR